MNGLADDHLLSLVDALLCPRQFLRRHIHRLPSFIVSFSSFVHALLPSDSATTFRHLRTGYEVCSYVISGILVVGVLTMVVFAPSDPAILPPMEQPPKDIGQMRPYRRWTAGRLIKAALLTIGKFCYGFFTPFFMRDFMWAWLSTGFYWTGALTMANFMQYYYTVRTLLSLSPFPHVSILNPIHHCMHNGPGRLFPSIPLVWDY